MSCATPRNPYFPASGGCWPAPPRPQPVVAPCTMAPIGLGAAGLVPLQPSLCGTCPSTVAPAAAVGCGADVGYGWALSDWATQLSSRSSEVVWPIILVIVVAVALVIGLVWLLWRNTHCSSDSECASRNCAHATGGCASRCVSGQCKNIPCTLPQVWNATTQSCTQPPAGLVSGTATATAAASASSRAVNLGTTTTVPPATTSVPTSTPATATSRAPASIPIPTADEINRARGTAPTYTSSGNTTATGGAGMTSLSPTSTFAGSSCGSCRGNSGIPGLGGTPANNNNNNYYSTTSVAAGGMNTTFAGQMPGGGISSNVGPFINTSGFMRTANGLYAGSAR